MFITDKYLKRSLHKLYVTAYLLIILGSQSWRFSILGLYVEYSDMWNNICISRKNHGKSILWLCLYPNCYALGCGEERDDHSTLHNQENPSHCIQLNISTWRSWCYACNNELLLTRNTPPVKGVLGRKHKLQMLEPKVIIGIL